jgi:hypothetical protein
VAAGRSRVTGGDPRPGWTRAEAGWVGGRPARAFGHGAGFRTTSWPIETDAAAAVAVLVPALPAADRNVVETSLVARKLPAVAAASAPSIIAHGGVIVVARAIPKRPTSTLPARVAAAGPVVIEVELTAFGEPVVPAIGLMGSTPAKALIVPAAASALENVQVQVADPVSAEPATWR